MGYLHIYTGDGKGKTTCALGLVMRAAGAGWRVAFAQFDKGFDGNNEHYHERKILRTLPGVDLAFFGMERMQPDGKFRFTNTSDDFLQAKKGLEQARALVSGNQSSGKHYDMVVLDELVTCAGTGLLEQAQIEAFVRDYRKAGSPCELILTGRGAWESLIHSADLVTEMKLVSHYWYSHKQQARPGVDY